MPSTFTENWDGVTAPALPAQWATDSGTFSVTDATKGFQSSPNALFPGVDAGAAHWVYSSSADSFGGDGTIVHYLRLTGAISAIIHYRTTSISAVTDTCYLLQLLPAADATNGVKLQRGNASSFTTLGSVTASSLLPTAATGYRVTIVAKGQNHKVEVFRQDTSQYLTSSATWSGSQQNCIDFTDSGGSSIVGSGRHGVSWYRGSSGNSAAFDDYSFAPLSVTATLGTTPINVAATGTATASGFTGGTVTWSSSNTSVATINSSTGVYTGVGAGTCTFTATGAANTTQTATTGSLTVTSTTPAVSPTSATIDQLATTTITASGFTGGTVTWSSSNTGVATVNSSGVVTGVAHGSGSNQTATITATGVSNGAQTATSTVTVRAVAVSVSPSTATLGTGTTQTFTATVTGSTNTAVTWSVSAGTGSINSSTGVYTAPGSAGSATVLATSTADAARTGSAAVTIVVATTITAGAYFGAGYAGLVGTVGFAVYSIASGVKTLVQARTTSGVIESTTSTSGNYIAQFTGASPGTTYLIEWDTGGSSPVYDSQLIDARAWDTSGRVAANTVQLAGQTVTAATGVTFPGSIASPTNITAGTLTTATNLTNLPAMPTDWITSLGLSAAAVTKLQSGLSTYAGGDTAGTTTLLARLTATRAGYIDNLATAPPTSAVIAAAVWDLTTTGHTSAGSFGSAMNAAGATGDPWSTSLPGAYALGTAGYAVGHNLDAQVSTRSTYAGGAVASVTAPVTVSDKTGYSLAAAGLDQVAVESINARQALATVLDACTGVLSVPIGAGTALVKNAAGATRAAITVDGSGNRTAVSYSPPA